jgi:hypothetical protein
MRKLFPLILTFAAALAAGDLSGTWNGEVNIGDDIGSAFMELKQDGEAITGKAGESAADSEVIKNAKLEGKRLSFEVSHHGRVFKLAMDLVTDDKLEGTIDGESESGEKISGKISFKKAS